MRKKFTFTYRGGSLQKRSACRNNGEIENLTPPSTIVRDERDDDRVIVLSNDDDFPRPHQIDLHINC